MNHSPLPSTTEPTDATSRGEGCFAAVENVFREHQSEIFRTLYFLLNHREDAVDAMQEAFLRCWKHRRELPDIRNLKAWVFRIALNVGRDIRKSAWNRRKKTMPEDDCFIALRELSPENRLAEKELLSRLQQAVGELREQEKEIYLLRETGEFTYEQIAGILQTPVGTVKTRMKRAIATLRQALRDFQG